MRLPLLAISLLLASAGCINATPSASDSATLASGATGTALGALNSTTSAANASVDAPIWAAGDAYAIATDNRGVTEESVLVVTNANGDGYTLSTTSPTLATYDAMFDISYVGHVRAADLAGDQKGTAVQFFSFPLTDGKTWRASWDGLVVNVTAKAASNIPTPLGNQPGFTIVAMDGNKAHATYDYVPALKWWSHIEFAGGYGLKVTKLAHNWTGSYVVATAKSVYDSSTAAPVVTINTQTFNVDASQTTLMLSFTGRATAWARGFALLDPNNQPMMTNQSSDFEAHPDGSAAFTSESLPATAGTWKISSPVLHHPDGKFRLQVFEVKVETRPYA